MTLTSLYPRGLQCLELLHTDMDKRLQDILAQAEIDRQNSLSRIAEIEKAIQQQQEQQAKLDRLSKIDTRKMTLKQLLQFSEELDTLW